MRKQAGFISLVNECPRSWQTELARQSTIHYKGTWPREASAEHSVLSLGIYKENTYAFMSAFWPKPPQRLPIYPSIHFTNSGANVQK